jgi:hypothetical protein
MIRNSSGAADFFTILPNFLTVWPDFFTGFQLSYIKGVLYCMLINRVRIIDQNQIIVSYTYITMTGRWM